MASSVIFQRPKRIEQNFTGRLGYSPLTVQSRKEDKKRGLKNNLDIVALEFAVASNLG